jgi:hypothetical protein
MRRRVIVLPPMRRGLSGLGQTVTASIQNTSRPGQPLQVGDSWLVTVMGPPNSPVSNTASIGNWSGSAPYGSTDENGNFTLTGQATASTVGTWTETWSVGGINAPAITFTVSPAPAPSPTPAPTPAPVSVAPVSVTTPISTTTPATPVTPAPASTTAAAPGCFSFLSQFNIPDPCVGSFPVGVGTVIAGLLGIWLLSELMGGRR